MQFDCTPDVNSRSTGALKVFAGLARAALKNGQHAAFGLWTLARSIDRAGSGNLTDEALRAAALDLGWSDYKYRRARRAALKLDLMLLTDGVLYLRSLPRAAAALKADRIAAMPIGVDRAALKSTRAWRAALRDVWLAGSTGKQPMPISRATIAAATGLSPRTQSRFNKMNRGRVNVIHNFARLARHFDPANLAGLKQSDPAVYAKDGALWRTLPATYDVSEEVYPRLKRGRCRKGQGVLNYYILRSNELVTCAAGERSELKQACRYHEVRKSAYKAINLAGRGKRALPDEMYVLSGVRESSNGRRLYGVWFAYPERDGRMEV